MDWGMIGHGWAVNLLAEHIAQKQERHAYLFTGPQGVGKRTLALRFVQGLNCLKPPAPGVPCRSCNACQRIERMQYPDLSVVSSEREGEVLKIDQVRELQHSLALAPYEGRYRAALILRFEDAHSSAANAMLKTLEEPPSQVVVLLTAKSAESLLPTIVSRCEVIKLRPLSVEETANGLQAIKGLPLEKAVELAHISGGRPGYAIRLFEQPRLLEQRAAWMEHMLQILRSPLRERFAFAKELAEDKEELRNELQTWLTLWRDIFISVAGTADSITNQDHLEQIKKLAHSLSIKSTHECVSAIQRTMEQIDRNVNARLAMEVLLMDLPRINLSV